MMDGICVNFRELLPSQRNNWREQCGEKKNKKNRLRHLSDLLLLYEEYTRMDKNVYYDVIYNNNNNNNYNNIMGIQCKLFGSSMFFFSLGGLSDTWLVLG